MVLESDERIVAVAKLAEKEEDDAGNPGIEEEASDGGAPAPGEGA
jgi:hypothetical protein